MQEMQVRVIQLFILDLKGLELSDRLKGTASLTSSVSTSEIT